MTSIMTKKENVQMKKNDAMSSVDYVGQLRCRSTHHRSGQVIETDAPTDNHGKGMKFSPTDLMSTSLANCMLTVMGIRTQQMTGSLDGSSADVFKVMADQPRRVQKIIVHLYLKGGGFSEKERKVLENVGRTCPVALSLSDSLEQELHFHWED